MNVYQSGSGRWALIFGALLLAIAGGCNRPTTEVAEQPKQLPSDDELRDRTDAALDFTLNNRHLDTKDQAAWQIVHGVLAYGRDFQIYKDGQLVPALDYLLGGGELRGWTMRKGDHGVDSIVEAGSSMGQGHEDQWLGYLSQVGLKPEQVLVVGGENFTVRDLITQAQWDIHDGMEATWTLMAFTTYLPLDAEWPAKDGTTWTIPRMVEMESRRTSQPAPAAARTGCMAWPWPCSAIGPKEARLRPTAPAPGTRQRKIDDAVRAVREYQQPDGSLSTAYFARAATAPDIAVRISTTGHALEFLTVALSDDDLKQPWVTRAALNLVESLEKTKDFDLECGALYHAVHGLELYRARRFGPRTPAAASETTAAAQQ